MARFFHHLRLGRSDSRQLWGNKFRTRDLVRGELAALVRDQDLLAWYDLRPGSGYSSSQPVNENGVKYVAIRSGHDPPRADWAYSVGGKMSQSNSVLEVRKGARVRAGSIREIIAYHLPYHHLRQAVGRIIDTSRPGLASNPNPPHIKLENSTRPFCNTKSTTIWTSRSKNGNFQRQVARSATLCFNSIHR